MLFGIFGAHEAIKKWTDHFEWPHRCEKELGLFTICTKVRRVKYVSTNNILYTGIDVFLEVGAIKHGLEKIFLFWDCRYTDNMILYGNLIHKIRKLNGMQKCAIGLHVEPLYRCCFCCFCCWRRWRRRWLLTTKFKSNQIKSSLFSHTYYVHFIASDVTEEIL